MELASHQANSIQEWWFDNLSQENIKGLNRWFKWWEQRISRWGDIKPNVSNYAF